METTGYLKNNQFEVLITPPRILLNNNLNNFGTSTATRSILNNLRFRIEQVTSPSINLVSADISRYGIGPTQKQPYNAQYQDLSFSIVADGFGEVYQLLYNWVNSIFNYNGTESARIGAANRIPTYTSEYKENYSTTMQIVIYDMYGNVIHRINLYEAFPSSIREFRLGWNDSQNLMRLAVSVTYSEYSVVGSVLEGFQQSSSISLMNSFQRSNSTAI